MKQFEMAVQALRDIINPIGAVRRELKPGEKIEGCMAILLANDANHLKNIARQAINKIEEAAQAKDSTATAHNNGSTPCLCEYRQVIVPGSGVIWERTQTTACRVRHGVHA